MAQYPVTITAGNPQESVSLPFNAAAVVVTNPTSSPLYIRIGAPDIPSSINADIIIPDAKSETHPVRGRTFALAAGNPSSLAGNAAVLSGLYTTITVTFLSSDEIIPTFGSYDFRSFSLSDLSGGFVAYAPGTVQTYDLGAWGGAMIMIAPVPGSGQGFLNIEASVSPLANFVQIGLYSFWPSVPSMLILPRPVRYMRVTFMATGIPGEPGISGFVAARGTMSEVNQLTYTPTGTPMTVAYNIPNLGSTSKILATRGIQSISVSVSNTTGNNNGELLIESAQAVGGPWQVVAFREQIINPAGGTYASLFRTYGNLGPFTRVTLLSTGVSGAIAGNLYLSITPEPDINGILQQIYSALGDVGNTVNVDQSIFHLLAHMRATLTNIETFTSYDQALGNIEIYTNTAQSKLTSMQTLESANLPSLPGIKTDLDSMVTLENANLPYLSFLQNINGYMSTTGNITISGWVNVPAVAGFQALGPVFTGLAGRWLVAVQFGIAYAGAAPGVASMAGFSIGTAGAAAAGLSVHAFDGSLKAYNFPQILFAAVRTPGVLIQPTWTTLWWQNTLGLATTVHWNVVTAA